MSATVVKQSWFEKTESYENESSDDESKSTEILDTMTNDVVVSTRSSASTTTDVVDCFTQTCIEEIQCFLKGYHSGNFVSFDVENITFSWVNDKRKDAPVSAYDHVIAFCKENCGDKPTQLFFREKLFAENFDLFFINLETKTIQIRDKQAKFKDSMLDDCKQKAVFTKHVYVPVDPKYVEASQRGVEEVFCRSLGEAVKMPHNKEVVINFLTNCSTHICCFESGHAFNGKTSKITLNRGQPAPFAEFSALLEWYANDDELLAFLFCQHSDKVSINRDTVTLFQLGRQNFESMFLKTVICDKGDAEVTVAASLATAPKQGQGYANSVKSGLEKPVVPKQTAVPIVIPVKLENPVAIELDIEKMSNEDLEAYVVAKEQEAKRNQLLARLAVVTKRT